MAELKEGRILVLEDEGRSEFLKGAEAAFKAVVTSYGPKGKNVLIERGFGRPTLTRDGWTIVSQVFFEERVKNMGSQLLIEASTAANNIAGDGSSATVVLSYFLFENSVKAIAAGMHPMDVRATLNKDSSVLLEALEKLAIPVKDAQLKEVATVSSGDPLIGELIADAVLYVGQDGGILTEKAPTTEVEREYVDGYYLQSGFTALQAGKKELVDPYVVVSSKRLASAADAIEILNGVMKAGNMQEGQIPRVLFVGNIEDAAYTTIVNTINAGQLDAVIIKTPPMYGELGKYLLSDIALYAGCELISENTNLKNFVVIRSGNQSPVDAKPYSPFIGSIDKVIASKSESTIFANNETEAVQTRIAEIKDQIETEESPAISEKLRDRVAKLEGKICIFKIGAPTDTEKEELEFRIEDAINSTRNAHAEGIVAGGGVTLLELSKLDISDIYRKALQSTFQQLLVNANLPAEIKLAEALNAPKGQGFNLRRGDKLVDVIKDGIIDPVVVPREVIKNATSAIGGAVTIGASLIFTDTPKG